MGALVGPIMRETKGRADGGEVNRLLLDGAAARASRPRVWHEQRDLDAVLDLQLHEQSRHVGLHGRDAHVQLGRDLGVRAPAADRARPPRARGAESDSSFACAASRRPPSSATSAISRRVTLGESVPVARVDVLDRAHDLRRRRVLQQEPGRARPQRPQHELVGVEGRQHDHRRAATAARAAAASPRSRPAAACGCPSARRRAGAGRPRRARRARRRPRPRPRSPARPRASSAGRSGPARRRRPAGRGSHGSVARRTKSPRGVRPVVELAAGQLDALGQPDQPGPAPGTVSARDRRPAADDDDQSAPRRRPTVTSTAAAGACLRAFVSPSWTIR